MWNTWTTHEEEPRKGTRKGFESSVKMKRHKSNFEHMYHSPFSLTGKGWLGALGPVYLGGVDWSSASFRELFN